MNIEDDDLPVLTQVLRTGSGHAPIAAHEEAHEGAASGGSVHSRVDAADALPGPDGEPTWLRALVIGSDPEPHDPGGIGDVGGRPSGHDAPSVPGAGMVGSRASDPAVSTSLMSVADPRRIDRRDNDVFLRTAPTETAFTERIDEPPLIARHGGRDVGDGNDAASSITVSRDVPLAFHDRPASATSDHDTRFALRVRDSVLDELSGRIDTELDARIAQTLHAEVETALAHLQTRLRAELAEALRDVVGHAVDDAVRRLRDTPA